MARVETEGAGSRLQTMFLLAARYEGRPVVPVAEVCRDFFAPLTLDKFLRKASAGDIALPIVRMESSQKAAKGVHLSDLADYLDGRRAAAKKELAAINRL